MKLKMVDFWGGCHIYIYVMAEQKIQKTTTTPTPPMRHRLPPTHLFDASPVCRCQAHRSVHHRNVALDAHRAEERLARGLQHVEDVVGGPESEGNALNEG